MRETAADIDALQSLLDRSIAAANEHLRGIVNPSRQLSAGQIAAALTGMRVLVVATVTAAGEPRTSCVDGHFLNGRWIFTTSGTATKARHLATRPAVSCTYVDGEKMAVFTHGTAERVMPGTADFADLDAFLTAHYGDSPTAWGPDIAFFRVHPTWMVGYADAAAGYPDPASG